MQRHLQLFAHGPNGVVARVVEVDHLAHVRGRKQHARKPMFLGPANLGDGVVEILQENLGHAGPAPWSIGTEVDQPAETCRPALEFLVIARVQIWLVAQQVSSAMAIRGDDHVPLRTVGHDFPSLEATQPAAAEHTTAISIVTRYLLVDKILLSGARIAGPSGAASAGKKAHQRSAPAAGTQPCHMR